jgi:Flp pilus assembly CpaE family ATPase
MTVPEQISPARSRSSPAGRRSRVIVLSEKPHATDAGASGVDAPAAMDTHVKRGQLLAVCGLCGGAGTSTVAYLVALAVARTDPGSVLVGDTGGPTAGISYYAGVDAPRSLTELAEEIVSGQPTGPPLATTGEGVRVLATGPRFAAECPRAGIELLLDQARERYALCVIDCGTLARKSDLVALASASHVAWVLPASAGGARRAIRVLDAITPTPLGREVIVARHDGPARAAPLKELKHLAARRGATLVLLPRVPDLATGDIAAALDAAQVSLQAIQGLLAR